MNTRRVVIDTSTLIGAALRPRSVPDRAVNLAFSDFQVCTSLQHLEELERVLRKTSFDSYIDLRSRLALFETFRDNATIVDLPDMLLDELHGSSRDENDDYLLAIILVARADVLISSDHDLLTLHPWRGIPILTPAQFLDQI